MAGCRDNRFRCRCAARRITAEEFSENLSLLTIHRYVDPLYIPGMLTIWDPDGGSTSESSEASSTFPQRFVRVLLQCHLRIVTNLFRSLYKREKVPKERRASTLGAIELA